MITLVTGGAASGKSAYAEQRAMALGRKRVYIATMPVYGAEDEARVQKHRKQRSGKGFETLEWEGLVERFCSVRGTQRDNDTDPSCRIGDVVLLEDLATLVSRLMFSPEGKRASRERAIDDALGIVRVLAQQCDNLVVVGNEVGCDGIRYSSDTLEYIDALGTVCCKLASASDNVVECIAGIVHAVKGEV